MARLIDRLTAIEVRRLSEPGLYPDGGGLYLQVSPGGAKSWIYRFTLQGRARAMGLGPHHIVSLAEARNLAREARRLRHERIDPIEQRKSLQAEADLSAAQQVTFMDAARAYIDANKAAWRNDKHKAQWTDEASPSMLAAGWLGDPATLTNATWRCRPILQRTARQTQLLPSLLINRISSLDAER